MSFTCTLYFYITCTVTLYQITMLQQINIKSVIIKKINRFMLLKISERKQFSSPIPLILHLPPVFTIDIISGHENVLLNIHLNILPGDEKMKRKIHIFIISIFKVPPRALNKESMLLTCLHKYQHQ